MGFLRRLTAALCVGYVLVFFSELVFWGRALWPGMGFPSLLWTWLVYSILAYAYLATVELARARSLWALFLAAAVFGWLVEGVVAGTTYDAFPLNLSWTALAWHAWLSVLFGWELPLRLLRRSRSGGLLLWTLGGGLFWGGWAVFWWRETGTVTPSGVWLAYALAAAAPLPLCYWAGANVLREPLRPGRWSVASLGLLAAGLFAVHIVPQRPWALAILPPLLALTLAALVRNRRTVARAEAVGADAAAVPTVRLCRALLVLGLVPPAAAVYLGLLALELRPPTNVVVFLISVPAGAVMYLISLWRVWRAGRAAADGG